MQNKSMGINVSWSVKFSLASYRIQNLLKCIVKYVKQLKYITNEFYLLFEI